MVEDHAQPYNATGIILCLQVGRRDIYQHVAARTAMARRCLQWVFRFAVMSTKTKKLLYAAFVRPLLEYPPGPLYTM